MRKGFTLIEVLVTVSMVILLSGGVIAAFSTFNENQTLKSTSSEMLSNLRFAQTKAITGDTPSSCSGLSGYSLTFTADTLDYYTIEAVCSGGSITVNTVYLPKNVKFLALPSPITFKIMGQGVVNPTNIDFCGFNKVYRVTLTVTGEIIDAGKQPGSC